MVGAVIIVVVLVLVFPVLVLMTGGAAAGILGWVLKEDAEARGDDVWKQLNT